MKAITNKADLLLVFPNSSGSLLAVNPQLVHAKGKQNDSTGIMKRKRGIMNKTEAEFALMLESARRRDEIIRYEFEGITLRWADMRYTPDFVLFNFAAKDQIRLAGSIKLIEVKGGHIWDRDIVRFKGARAYWPEFAFEMWQKMKAGWKRKY